MPALASAPARLPPADLVADRLTCRRGERTLFRDLSFTVAAGSGLVLSGRNGTGKTSLLRILAGLLPASRGSVALAGADDGVPLAEQAHFVGTKDGLKPALTPREHVRFWFALAGADADARTGDAAGEFGVMARRTGLIDDSADIPVALLSSGQRKRLSLLRLFVPQRRIWLLDEPLNTLDDVAQAMVRDWAIGFMDRGGIAVIATHTPIDLPRVAHMRLGPPAEPDATAPDAGSFEPMP